MNALTMQVLLNKRFKQFGVEANDQPLSQMTLIAQSLAYDLDLPAQKIENVKQWFLIYHKNNVLHELNKYNEQQVIDIDQAYEMTYQIWYTRYQMAFEPTDPKVQEITMESLGKKEPLISSLMTKYPRLLILNSFDRESIK